MDDQKRNMMAIVLRMIKEVYHTTVKLEEVLGSSSVQILSRDFDPLNELLEAMEYPQEKTDLVYELIQVYLENEMTLEEVVMGIESGMKEVSAVN
ncbi:MAG: hypothetical protein M0Z65_09095 [Firmicutes bacterium]|jgi:hypothetical protein|uniref:Uncharacterized protein n=1 Tax=Melghirimyces thermohalophilus TaxID=1236220 RepID=A0A1G6KUX4_9BACL|nr:hypothetical protein [Melghirimyces thermohalophilus]MDA8353320.1 hypothetical protein [Bacillota bacterium]SDC34764.1 hypothetical protein SAMN04488112_106173 [Melghirimyces thermohalophilus]